MKWDIEELSYIGIILIPVEEVTSMITNSDAVIMGAATEGLLSYPMKALICKAEDV